MKAFRLFHVIIIWPIALYLNEDVHMDGEESYGDEEVNELVCAY